MAAPPNGPPLFFGARVSCPVNSQHLNLIEEDRLRGIRQWVLFKVFRPSGSMTFFIEICYAEN
jgi:hypothetical protein